MDDNDSGEGHQGDGNVNPAAEEEGGDDEGDVNMVVELENLAVLPPPEGYGVRRPPRETNFLYRADAMDREDVFLIDNLFAVSEYFMLQARSFFSFGVALFVGAQNYVLAGQQELRHLLEGLSIAFSTFAALLWNESILYYHDTVDLIYYPLTNRHPPAGSSRFTEKRNIVIDDLQHTVARDLFGLNKLQLRRLYVAYRFPDQMHALEPRRDVFTGEEVFLYYLCYLRTGNTYVALREHFGGDPRRFSYAIRLAVSHLYRNFYHKISGDSMRMWTAPEQVNAFRYAIYQHFLGEPHREEVWADLDVDPAEYTLGADEFPFETFRIFGFLDDYAVHTTRVGDALRRRLGFVHDVQRAFYSGYFRFHGLKVQVVYLPNGMVGSIFIASLAHNDRGMQNMSGLNDYLVHLLSGQQLPPDGAFLPALYGDGIFIALPTIIPTYRAPLSPLQRRVNRRMAGSRISIEHILALHKTLFGLFRSLYNLHFFRGTRRRPNNQDGFSQGEHLRKLVLTSFLTLNCFTCLTHSASSMFGLVPPSLEQYLPIQEVLTPAPEVGDEQLRELGNIYYYGP